VMDTWTRKTDIPTPRGYLSASAVNGKIYAIGGRAGTFQNPIELSTVEEYDPATDTWTKKSDLPNVRYFLSTSVVDDKVYAVGGGPNGRATEKYDPATDTWTGKASMPTERSMLATSAANGKIYAIGGGSGLSTVEVYTPEGWRSSPVSPQGKLPTKWGQEKETSDSKTHG
jgi:N-acetylneuraminic acid mutarotase